MKIPPSGSEAQYSKNGEWRMEVMEVMEVMEGMEGNGE
jgi:hypothetical protein